MNPQCEVVIFLIVCLSLITSKGSPVQQLFVQTGSDIILDIGNPRALKGFDGMKWRFNAGLMVTVKADGDFFNNNTRVVYSPQNSSLTLKNLQKQHSGVYQAEVDIFPNDLKKISFDVQVQDPATPAELEVDSVTRSPGSCNFTVSCKTKLNHTNGSFTCGRLTCDPTPNDFTSSLHLYLSNVSIVCNHSNQVSWKSATKSIQQVCSEDPDPGKKNDIINTVIIVVTVLCVLFAVLAAVFWKRKKNPMIMVDNTVYEVPQGSSPHVKTRSVEKPDTIYSEVQPHSGPSPPPPAAAAAATQSPESLYATVNKPSTPDLLTSAT